MTIRRRHEALDWQGRPWTPQSSAGGRASEQPLRGTAVTECATLSPEFANPNGVPIDAILFGARRQRRVPLVFEARDWQHGTFLGATLSSETTAAATGKVGVLRRDPMAMWPFCGYNMGDYFRHWLDVGKSLSKPPEDLPCGTGDRATTASSSGPASATTSWC